MDRISFSQHTGQTASPAMLREPKLIDASARLKFADRADTVELSSQAERLAPTSAAKPAPSTSPSQVAAQGPSQGMSRLIAARVTEPTRPASVTPAAARAMRFYADPSDQNAAATLGAGSSLDILA